MNFFQTTLQRVQLALPSNWLLRLPSLVQKNQLEVSCDAPRPATPPFSTPYFPPIDWSDTDRMIDENDPLAALDRTLQGSPRYHVSSISCCDGLYGAHNASQTRLDQCLMPKPGAGAIIPSK